jgi:flagellar secretion chaperone FliS
MNPSRTDLSYRRASVENASAVGLVIILYDLLIHDLGQAMEAIAKKDVEARSKAIKHAFLVLQQLEGSLERENGGEAADNLSKFYAVMRARIFEAHTKVVSEILEEQVRLLLDVRQAWEKVDPAKAVPATSAAPANAVAVSTSDEASEVTASWTA